LKENIVIKSLIESKYSMIYQAKIKKEQEAAELKLTESQVRINGGPDQNSIFGQDIFTGEIRERPKVEYKRIVAFRSDPKTMQVINGGAYKIITDFLGNEKLFEYTMQATHSCVLLNSLEVGSTGTLCSILEFQPASGNQGIRIFVKGKERVKCESLKNVNIVENEEFRLQFGEDQTFISVNIADVVKIDDNHLPTDQIPECTDHIKFINSKIMGHLNSLPPHEIDRNKLVCRMSLGIFRDAQLPHSPVVTGIIGQPFIEYYSFLALAC
jgi:hypothetical protein